LYQIAIGTVVLRVDPEYYRPTEVDLDWRSYEVKKHSGMEPQYDLAAMVKERCMSDLKLLIKTATSEEVYNS
jgi:GDPmannose 4,6-dehydratase